MTDKNPFIAVFIIATIGGLAAGFVCLLLISFTIGETLQSVSEQIQNISIACSTEINPFASEVAIDNKIYYCSIEVKEKELNDFNNIIINSKTKAVSSERG